MKRTIALIIALETLLFALTACGKGAEGITTLYEGNAVKIEREEDTTRIYDLVGNTEYTFTTHRARTKKAESVRTAKTNTITDTIKIMTVHELIIVETADGKTLYVK